MFLFEYFSREMNYINSSSLARGGGTGWIERIHPENLRCAG